MNRVMITGLAIQNELSECKLCNVDLEWLYRCPSMLLWADRILVTKDIWRIVTRPGEMGDDPFTKSCKTILEICQARGLVEYVNPTPILTGFSDFIHQQVYKDMKDMQRVFPDKAKLKPKSTNEPEMLVIDGVNYCPVHLLSIHANLLLARIWDVRCLFDWHTLNYCRYKYGLGSSQASDHYFGADCFKEAFRTLLPNTQLIPQVVLGTEGQCRICARSQTCRTGYLGWVEKETNALLLIVGRLK